MPRDRLNCPTKDVTDLADGIIRLESEVALLKVQLKQSQLDHAACKLELAKWPGSCPVLVPEKRDPFWPVMGYVGGVLGTVLMGAALVMPLPLEWRVGMGAVGAVSAGAGVVLVLP